MQKNQCLLCKSNKFTELLQIEKFPIFFGAIPQNKQGDVQCYPLTIAICDKCALVQQTNLLDENVLNEVYQADYYNCPSPMASGMGVREIGKFYSFFQDCHLKTGKLLEIACFDGYLLNKFQNDGWEVYGCDPSSMTKVTVDKFGKKRIVNDFFTEKTFAPESFDVIVFRNLLEHLYDIHSFLENVSFCLKNGGRIFVDVPNVNELLDIGGFGTFFHQHLSYFSMTTLSGLLAQHGFEIEQSHAGKPNLFVSAIKTDEIHTTDSKSPIKIIKEIEQYLDANLNIKDRINQIFDNHENQNISLFGASALATTIINFLQPEKVSKIKNIFDNDSQKHGKSLFGCDSIIHSPDQLAKSNFDLILITTYFFDKEIKEQLVEMGVDQNKIITFS
jgi:2-polyprenyl-3-methyl-5-hydroxy-6-metoxy-1,4-benzoquinol methylase